MSSDIPAKGTATYRQVVIRGRLAEGTDIWAVTGAGWDLLCCNCAAVLGRLSIPFSGGYILAGNSSHLDPRLVERDGPEKQTGFRRYGPPTRVHAKGKTQRSASAARPGLGLHGSFWVYCHRCNTGQAVEPERLTR